MMRIHPKALIAIGFILVLFGFLVPFLTIIGVIGANLPLNFASYTASVIGLLLGLVGAAWHSRFTRR
jgi:hypothetical protein